jgi:predicted branched-subunit amino acid permease
MTVTITRPRPRPRSRAGGSERGTRPRGHVDAAPLILGYLPFALVMGASITASSVANVAGWASSPLIFAGASQLALLEVLDGGSTVAIAVMTALAINLRHVMYSASLAPWMAGQDWRWRLAAPLLLNDPQFLLVSRRFPELPDDAAKRRYYLELGLTLLLAWSSMTAIGVVIGSRLPDTLPFDVIVPLTFLALLVPSLTDRPSIGAAVAGGSVAVVAHGLPLHLGLLAGILAGVAAGMGLDEEHDDA